ncbi:glutamine synthetase adenylyltransferase [Anaerolinea thermophila]|nr:glutamine synthetase adenylyltransferase [Anaerolinea thermophila]
MIRPMLEKPSSRVGADEFVLSSPAQVSFLHILEFLKQYAIEESVLSHLMTVIEEQDDIERILTYFERLTSQPRSERLWFYLSQNLRVIEILTVLFSRSQFLSEILLRNPDLIFRLPSYRRMARPKSVEQFYSEAFAWLKENKEESLQWMNDLRRYQSAELLRIGICDLLDLYDLPAVTRQLSALADALIRLSLHLICENLNVPPEALTVIALGKLGGGELNYSSDIDLLFLTDSGDLERLQHVGERLIDVLSRVTEEGFLYRVDMRLRPWGRVGPLVSTIDGYLSYLKNHARPWEKQALLKARVISGSPQVKQKFIDGIHQTIFSHGVDEVRASVFAMKQRTEAVLKQKDQLWGEVKLGEGSVRDVEFTLQFLQLAYGPDEPEILTGNTLEGLVRLAALALIDPDEYRILSEGYIFLRTVEHYLQMMHYRQTHSLPNHPEALRKLARRLGYDGKNPEQVFLDRYEQHRKAIRAVFLKYVGNGHMSANSPVNSAQAENNGEQGEVTQHLNRMTVSYRETYTEAQIAQHARLARLLNEKIPCRVEAHPLEGNLWQVTIVALDVPGLFSIITGLLFVHGWNILSGDAFTYEALKNSAVMPSARDPRRKIVDVFIVQPVDYHKVDSSAWDEFSADLTTCLIQMRSGERREVMGDLTQRVAKCVRKPESLVQAPPLYPLEIVVDNDSSEHLTLLHIQSQDTVGFLYELTNALAITGIYIDRVRIETVNQRVRDVLYVTDLNGNKITSEEKLRELRTATVLIKHFTHLLPFSPNPENALLHFRDFMDQLLRRPNWTDEVASVERPEVLQALAQVLGVSDFLWEDFLRIQYTNLFPVVTDVQALGSVKSREKLQEEIGGILDELHHGAQAPDENAPWIEALNAWRDREMFRIDMRHILGHTKEFWDFASELTDLAEVVTNVTFHLCHEDLRSVYGTPLLDDGRICQMSVLGLGKFGGRELGFASDIELMFVYEGNGQTTGPKVISSAEFYEKLVEYFVKAMRSRREGIFEVDLRLRPYGKAGNLAVSLDAFRRYFSPSGPAWAYERQALVKMRPVAGDERLGETICRMRDEFIYRGEGFDVTAMRAMRERQIRHLVKGGTFNLKYSQGGLVDIEYLVQGLQMRYGAQYLEVRQTNTRDAMVALRKVGVISEEEYTRLRKAHTFLRWCIDSLRMVRGNARDVTLPLDGTEEYEFLAQRMRYGDDPQKLRKEVQRYSEDVRELNHRLLGGTP